MFPLVDVRGLLMIVNKNDDCDNETQEAGSYLVILVWRFETAKARYSVQS